MEGVVFLDESGFNTSMTRRYACAHSSLRAFGTVPRNHGINHTLICGLQLSGPMGELIIDGPVNGIVFEHYIREILCPQLKEGQTVVMDNLSSHHRESIRGLIEAKNCKLLYLPPYSPGDYSAPKRAQLENECHLSSRCLPRIRCCRHISTNDF